MSLTLTAMWVSWRLPLAVGDPDRWRPSSSTCRVIGLSFNQFFPQITTSLGYSRTISLLLCAPPFVWATIIAFGVARHSDAKQERFWHIIGPLCGGVRTHSVRTHRFWPSLTNGSLSAPQIVGFIIALSTSAIAGRYVSMFLMASSYAGFCVFLSWLSGSFPRPPMKRAVAIAWINAFSQLGNISCVLLAFAVSLGPWLTPPSRLFKIARGAYTFPAAWGPSYHNSFSIAIAMFCATAIGLVAHRLMLQRKNKQIEKAENEGTSIFPMGFRLLL
jgi:hypothetical protein